MNPIERGFLVRFALLFVIACCASCNSSDTARKAAAVSASESLTTSGDEKNADPGGTMKSPEAALVMEAFKEMAASKGIHFGEVPEGFPLDFLPLYPGGQIDKSGVTDEDFTLLQVVPADTDTVFAWYEEFYDGIGWSDSKLITVMGRTMTGFHGEDGKVDMTLIDREEGKTFVALALSPK